VFDDVLPPACPELEDVEGMQTLTIPLFEA